MDSHRVLQLKPGDPVGVPRLYQVHFRVQRIHLCFRDVELRSPPCCVKCPRLDEMVGCRGKSLLVDGHHAARLQKRKVGDLRIQRDDFDG